MALSFDFSEFDDDDKDDNEVSDNMSSNQECAELNAGKAFCVTYPVICTFVIFELSF